MSKFMRGLSILFLALLLLQAGILAVQIIVPECKKGVHSTEILILQILVEKWHLRNSLKCNYTVKGLKEHVYGW